jgi:hypothetical protein
LFVATAVAADFVLLALAMLKVAIVAIVASSVQLMAPVLVGKTMQFVVVAHALLRSMSLRR